jgi:hypothetical protein
MVTCGGNGEFQVSYRGRPIWLLIDRQDVTNMDIKTALNSTDRPTKQTDNLLIIKLR